MFSVTIFRKWRQSAQEREDANLSFLNISFYSEHSIVLETLINLNIISHTSRLFRRVLSLLETVMKLSRADKETIPREVSLSLSLSLSRDGLILLFCY